MATSKIDGLLVDREHATFTQFTFDFSIGMTNEGSFSVLKSNIKIGRIGKRIIFPLNVIG